MTRGSSRAREPLSRVNLTGFIMPTSGKNRKYLCIQKRNLKTSLKTGFAQNFSSCPKNLSYPNFFFFFFFLGGGGLHPRPPSPYAYGQNIRRQNRDCKFWLFPSLKCYAVFSRAVLFFPLF